MLLIHCLLIAICGIFKQAETLYVKIWDDNMDINSGWTGHNNFNFEWISNNCPSPTSPCTHVTANTNGASYIQKSTNISSYSSIQLQIDINAYDIQQTGSCQIWYNFDNSIYTKYSDWRYSKYTNLTINFPLSNLANILNIKLQMIGIHGACYWDNAILRGIPIHANISNIATFLPEPTDVTISYTNTPTLEPTLEPTQSFHRHINRIYVNQNRTAIFHHFMLSTVIVVFGAVLCSCTLALVIARLCCKKKKKNKKRKYRKRNINIRTLSSQDEASMSGQNIQITTNVNTMTPLQLSEYGSDSLITNGTHKQWIVPLKKGNYIGSNIITACPTPNVSVANMDHMFEEVNKSDSEDKHLPSEQPQINDYPTTTMTSTTQLNLSSVNSYLYGDRLLHVDALKEAVHDAKTSSQFSKLERILDKLENETVQIQQIMDDNTHEMSSTDTSTYSNTDTNTELDTITDTNLEYAPSHKCIPAHLNIIRPHCGVRYTETFM